MKDADVIRYIYNNVYARGEYWSEWDIYDWLDLGDEYTPKVRELVLVITETLERFIFSRYKFTGTRPDYGTLKSIWRFKKSYMHPLNKYRQKNRYYKPLKLKCLNYE